MKKISLKVNAVKEISSQSLSRVKGGGYNRSQRLGGNCGYSGKHESRDYCGDLNGCYPSVIEQIKVVSKQQSL